MAVLRPEEIVIGNIKFKKRIALTKDIWHIPIKYGVLTQDIYVQTPVLLSPFGINNYNNLDVSLIDTNSSFYQLIVTLNTIVTKKYSTMNFISSIKHDNFYPDRLRLNLSERAAIKVYDESRKLVSMDHLKPRTYAKYIVSPRSIWIKNNRVGVNWNVCQIKLYLTTNYLPENYAFLEDGPAVATKDDTIPAAYDKFFRMLKNGVPKEAIKMKMKMEQIDPDILDMKPAEFSNLPPPPSFLLNNPTDTNRGSLLATISGGVKLKKPNCAQNPKKNFGSHDNYVPSLNAITEALSNLKRNASSTA
jgi:hypothetical protein